MDKEKLGHYELKSELGRGGMGVVYKAWDPTLNRDVAIKVLSEALAHDTSVVERFLREAKSMAALNDAHIIQIYYIGEDSGQPFFVMEFVEGESLSQRLKRDGKLPVRDAKRIIRESAEGLALAHSKGMVHRDIKPGNLMLTPRGKIKIADFGIAMVQDYGERLTNTGEFVGTPGYLSPEVCVGQPVDLRSDIFALGIVFFEMLTGRIPFTESSPLGMMLEVVKAEIPDVRSINADVDERTCAILRKMIAKDPANRYQSCEELVVDLAGSGPVDAPAPVAGAAQPAASEFQQAATTALSQLEAMPELADQVKAPPQAPATQVSVDRGKVVPQKTGSSMGLPLALAAVLLLSVGGGSLYLFRDAIFGAEADNRPQVNVTTPSTSTPSTSTATSDSAEPAAGGDEPSESNLVSDADLEAEIRALSAVASGETTDGEGAEPTKQTIVAMTEPADPPADLPASSSVEEAKSTASSGATSDAQSASTQSQAQPAAQQGQQLAKLTTTPEPKRIEPSPPRDPRVVVVVIGDRAIAGPVESLLEEAIVADDHVLLDEGFFSGIGSVANERGVDLPGLSDLVMRNGGDILVLAEIDYLGETALQYYGQYSTMYSVQLKVRNILLSERRPVGRGYQQKVEFTTLNANDKAREAIEPYLSQLTEALRDLKRG